ncbi:hypothetical protein [Nocardia sp. CA-290969]|uniref:hypothetical protein n=1 Tax=Nocardia sp. CA-290969 TaxID=3239986 RepID=UPI003D9208C3
MRKVAQINEFDADRLPVPDIWSAHGWAQPYHFVDTLRRRAAGLDPATIQQQLTRQVNSAADQILTWKNVKSAMERRSGYAWATGTTPAPVLDALNRIVWAAMGQERWLAAGVHLQSVDGYDDGPYAFADHPRRLDPRTNGADPATMLFRTSQGQSWIPGDGLTFLLGIDWEFAAESGVDPDLAYAHALRAVGRLGHMLLLEGHRHGLSARMTPAVLESEANGMLEFGPDRDILYMIRMGVVAGA